MSRTAAALLALLVLVSATQWLWTRMASHVDFALMPAYSRRRVRWMLGNSAHIQLGLAAIAACVLCLAAFQPLS
jgi:hypothetical protein